MCSLMSWLDSSSSTARHELRHVVLREPDPETGKTKPVWHSGFPSLSEAKAFRDNRRAEVRTGKSVLRNVKTLGEYLLEWLPAHAATKQLKPSTIESYDEQIRTYLIPRLGHVRLQSLTAADIEAFYVDLLAGGGKAGRPLSPRTVQLTGTILKMALDKAVKVYKLIPSNPAVDVALPKPGVTVKKDVWKPQEMKAIMDAAANHRLWAYFVIAAASGARRGEVLGLRWKDVDFSTQTLTFSRNLVALRGKVVEGTLKNGLEKTVKIDPASLDVLQTHRRRQAAERLACPDWLDDDFVFTTTYGRPIHPRNINRVWKSIMASAGVRYFKPHTLRHTQATILLAAGVPLHVVAKRLGHKDAMVTATVYARSTDDQDDSTAIVYANWLQGGSVTDENAAIEGGR